MTKRLILMDTGIAPEPKVVMDSGIEIMGMRIILDGKDYIDTKDISIDDFYAKIESVKDFNTNPPMVWEIKKTYEDIRSRGFEELIGIHVSSKMSRLIEICTNAKNMVSSRLNIHIIDTGNVSAGGYLIADKIIDLLNKEKKIEEILEVIPLIRQSSFMQISLSTLKYLIKNGRLGKLQGIIGSILRMKPILGIDGEGFLTTVARERNKDVVMNQIADNAVEFLQKRRHNVKICLTYGLEKNKKQVETIFDIFMEKFKSLNIKDYKVIKGRILPTIACLSGPEAYAFAVYGEENPIE